MLNVFYRFFFKASAFSFKGKITKNSSGPGPAQWSKSGVTAPFPGSRAGVSGARKQMVPRILNLSLDQSYRMREVWGLSTMAHHSRCLSGWWSLKTRKSRVDGRRKAGEGGGSRTKGRNIPPWPGSYSQKLTKPLPN